jgi:hypothetical protein
MGNRALIFISSCLFIWFFHWQGEKQDAPHANAKRCVEKAYDRRNAVGAGAETL